MRRCLRSIPVLFLVLLAGCPVLPTDSAAVVDEVVSEGGLAGFATDWTDPATPFSATLVVSGPYGETIKGVEAVVNGTTLAADGAVLTIAGLTVGTVGQVVVRAPGYVPTSLALDPSRTLEGFDVVLMPTETTVSIDATAGGELPMSAGSVEFAGGFVTEAGAAYTGTVTVSGRSLDVERDLFDATGAYLPPSEAMAPELFIASVDSTGALVPSFPLAAIDVELADSAGNALELASGSPAQVSFLMSSVMEGAYATQYTEGAVLPITSRDPKTGAWAESGTCTVRQADGSWVCEGEVPHFSSAAVVAPTELGCVVADEVTVKHPANRSLVSRSQVIIGTEDHPGHRLNTHLYEDDGKLGVCGLVPITTTGWHLDATFQLGELGAALLDEPDPSEAIIFQHRELPDPVAANLDGLTREDLDTLDGCRRACAAVVGGTIEYEIAEDEVTDAAGDPEPIEGYLAPGQESPPAEGTDVDDDVDGETVLTDCDDNDTAIHTGAEELCDELDNDCDGNVDEDFPDDNGDGRVDCLDTTPDADGDGDPDETDCDDADATIHSGATESCDGVDNNCDGGVDDGFSDGDGDAEADCVDTDDDGDDDPDTTDCDDADATIYTGAAEACDGVDQDCDGSTSGESSDGDSDGLMDACDAHPTDACSCFTLADAEAELALSGGLCLRSDTSTVPDVAQYDGVYRDLGSGVFGLAGAAILPDSAGYVCGYGCQTSSSSTGTCADVGETDGLIGYLDSSGYAACMDLVAEVCP